MTQPQKTKEMVRTIACLNAAITNMRLYASNHPQVVRYLERAYLELKHLLRLRPEITFIVLDGQLLFDHQPLVASTPHVAQFARILAQGSVERVTFSSELTTAELGQLAGDLAATDQTAVRSTASITLGKLQRSAQPKPVTLSQEMQAKIETWINVSNGCQEQLKELYHQIRSVKQIQATGFETIVQTFIDQMIGHANPLLMLASLKSWDEYTFTHAINVCLLTMAQAEALGIGRRKLHDVGIAAALHDAGKMFVPDEILNKPGKLTEEEWLKMRHHAIRGAMQVLRMEGIPKLAFIGALEHHIRYDGSGYPTLHQWRPSLVGQMIAIADMFDAMRSRRAYQEPKPLALIVSILKKDSGTAFHPLLVENFLRIVEPVLDQLPDPPQLQQAR